MNRRKFLTALAVTPLIGSFNFKEANPKDTHTKIYHGNKLIGVAQRLIVTHQSNFDTGYLLLRDPPNSVISAGGCLFGTMSRARFDFNKFNPSLLKNRIFTIENGEYIFHNVSFNYKIHYISEQYVIIDELFWSSYNGAKTASVCENTV